jgi:hypothetical protein
MPQVKVFVRVRNTETKEEALMEITDDQPVDARLMRAAGYELAEDYKTAHKRAVERRRLDPDWEPQMVISSRNVMRVG